MSRSGRLDDAFHDILYGYEDGGGNVTKGPLHDLPYDELRKVIDMLADAAWSVLQYPPRGPQTDGSTADLDSRSQDPSADPSDGSVPHDG